MSPFPLPLDAMFGHATPYLFYMLIAGLAVFRPCLAKIANRRGFHLICKPCRSKNCGLVRNRR